MRKVLFIFAMLSCMMAFAQPSKNNTVYFGNVSKTTSVGLGINGNEVTLSLMEISKKNDFKKFAIKFYNMDGDPIAIQIKEDTIYHLELGKKEYAHQQDYKLTRSEYNKMKIDLGSQTTVVINGTEYNGAAFSGVLNSLELEQARFHNGQLGGLRSVSLWSWSQRGVEMMRFRQQGNRNFRYIRTLPQRNQNIQNPPQRPPFRVPTSPQENTE